jgi:hypothetical protein
MLPPLRGSPFLLSPDPPLTGWATACRGSAASDRHTLSHRNLYGRKLHSPTISLETGAQGGASLREVRGHPQELQPAIPFFPAYGALERALFCSLAICQLNSGRADSSLRSE